MTQPKVAHITTVDMSLRYLLLNQLRSLRAAGYDVAGISAPGPDVPALEAAGIRHIAVPMTRALSPAADLISFWRLYRVLRRERFTIIHTHTPKPGLYGQLAARLAGVPIVVNTLHGFYFHDRMPRPVRAFFVVLEKVAATCSDVILSQNREDMQTAVREGIALPARLRYLGNGIDLRRFDPAHVAPDRLAALRRELGLPPDAPVIGFVGRLAAAKGILDVLEAARLVRERLPGVRLLIVGPVDVGKPDAVGPEMARAHGVADMAIFTGLRQDMPELYALLNVFALPSWREGFPRAPMEASAMGVPCILSDVSGCREAVEPERNGLLVPPGDVRALADAIVEILTDSEKARRLGEGGRRLARERFDEQTVFEKVKTEYARLLREKKLALPAARLESTSP